jgi:hypothetical protein
MCKTLPDKALDSPKVIADVKTPIKKHITLFKETYNNPKIILQGPEVAGTSKLEIMNKNGFSFVNEATN